MANLRSATIPLNESENIFISNFFFFSLSITEEKKKRSLLRQLSNGADDMSMRDGCQIKWGFINRMIRAQSFMNANGPAFIFALSQPLSTRVKRRSHHFAEIRL